MQISDISSGINSHLRFFFQIFNSKKNVFHGDEAGGVNRVIGTVRHLANKL